jgi:flavin-dependent thymidylate synthase
MQTGFVSSAPKVVLVDSFLHPLDNAMAAARTCYSSRIVTAQEVAKDQAARDLRDRIFRETYAAGHHTVMQHCHFQFTLENVSRQCVWSFLHAHPFYNSEQTSQRYVEVKPGNFLIPCLEPAEDTLYRNALQRMMTAYQKLVEMLFPVASEEYFHIFSGRKNSSERWAGEIKKKAQEAARYALPIAAFTQLHHTINGLSLFRYHRLAKQFDVPRETALVVEAMVKEVKARDPLFLSQMEDAYSLEKTLEYEALVQTRGIEPGGKEAELFVQEFDQSLQGRNSCLVDYSIQAQATLAQAVRSVLGLSNGRLSDEEAIGMVLSPSKNRYLAETIRLSTLSKLMRTLAHPHYTFRKRLSHTADSQDQRHRMVVGSRPVMQTHYRPGVPDYIVPELIRVCPQAQDLFEREMKHVFADIDRLLSSGVEPENTFYLLPNAFPIRFQETGDLLHWHHKWTTRLCFTAQEEIWRTSREEVEQIRSCHPNIGEHLMPPCQLRDKAGIFPRCPEGARFCGVPVWEQSLGDLQRIL